jgi:hypothetical protein
LPPHRSNDQFTAAPRLTLFGEVIGSGSAFVEGFVLAVIDRLSQRYARAVYHLMPGTLLALYDQLRERRIELAFSGDSALDR